MKTCPRCDKVWLENVSADRCCMPGWSRQLRADNEHEPGDAPDGVNVVRGIVPMRWVWNFSGLRAAAAIRSGEPA